MSPLKLTLLPAMLIALNAAAATPPIATPSVDERVDAIMRPMTLEQKIDLIGGVDDFYIRGMKASDGPG